MSAFPPVAVWDIETPAPTVSIPVRDDSGSVVSYIRYKGMTAAPRSGFDSVIAAMLADPARGRLIGRYIEEEPAEADDLIGEMYPQVREKGMYNEQLHPRDQDGKFIPKAAIARAARDPRELKRLQAMTTHPEERKKLHAAVQAIQAKPMKGQGLNTLPAVGKAVPGRQSVAETADHIHRLRAEVGEGQPTGDHIRRLAALLAWHSVAELRELKDHLGVRVSGDPGKENVVGNLSHRALKWREEQMAKVKAERAKRQLTSRLKAEGHTGTDEHGREWVNGQLVTGKKPEPHTPMDQAEFERRMAGVDPRDSGRAVMPERERPASLDDRDIEARAAAGDRRQRMMDWSSDKPDDMAAAGQLQAAEGRVRRAGGGESLGEDDLPPGKVAQPVPARVTDKPASGTTPKVFGSKGEIEAHVKALPAQITRADIDAFNKAMPREPYDAFGTQWLGKVQDELTRRLPESERTPAERDWLGQVDRSNRQNAENEQRRQAKEMKRAAKLAGGDSGGQTEQAGMPATTPVPARVAGAEKTDVAGADVRKRLAAVEARLADADNPDVGMLYHEQMKLMDERDGLRKQLAEKPTAEPAVKKTGEPAGTDYHARISALKPGKSADIDGHTVTRGEMDPGLVTIETPGQGRRVDTLAGAVAHLGKLAGGKANEQKSNAPETPDSPPTKTAKDLPPSIRDQVKAAIGRHNLYRDAIRQGRETDKQFGGDGRYEHDAHKNSRHHLEAGNGTLTEFRRVAGRNGFDPEAVIREMGGGEIPELSDAAKSYGDPDYRPAEKQKAEQKVEQPAAVEEKPTGEQVSHPILDKAAELHTDANAGVWKLNDRERFELATHLDKTTDPGITDAALRGENIIPRLSRAIADRKPKLAAEKQKAEAERIGKAHAESQAKRAAEVEDIHGKIVGAAKKNDNTRERVHTAAQEWAKGTKAAKDRARKLFGPYDRIHPEVQDAALERLGQAHKDGSLHETTAPEPAEQSAPTATDTRAGTDEPTPARSGTPRMSFEQEGGDEPAYPSAGRGDLFDTEGDEDIHEGPHHKAVNDLLTSAGRRFSGTQIGPRARHEDAHGEMADLDEHLNTLGGLADTGYDEMPFNATVGAHKGTVEALESGKFDDEDADDAVQHYREGEGNGGLGAGDGLSDLHQALSMSGHPDHAAWAQKHFDRLNGALEDDIRRRHEERQAPKKAALAEKLKNPGGLSEEEYEEHFPRTPWSDPKTGFSQWKTRDLALKAARENLPADHEANVVSNGGHYVVMARQRQDSHDGYDLSGVKEDVLNALHGEDAGRGLSEIREELSSRKHDPANPMAHPVHRAVKELENEGKIEVGSGSDPVVKVKADKPAPTAETPPTPPTVTPALAGGDSDSGGLHTMTRADAASSFHDNWMEPVRRQMEGATGAKRKKLRDELDRLDAQRRQHLDDHQEAVKSALAAGKTVPPEVMKDYPYLATPPASTPEPVPARAGEAAKPAGRSYPDHLYDTNPAHLLALRKIQAAQDKHQFAMPPVTDTGVDPKTVRELEKAGLVKRFGNGEKASVQVQIGGKMRMSAADELDANPELGDDLPEQATKKKTKKPDGNLYAAGKAILESGMTGIGDRPAEQDGPKAGTIAHEVGFQRKTPRAGTPEREKLDADHSAMSQREEELSAKHESLADELAKTRDGTKKADQLRDKKVKAWNDLLDHRQASQDVGKQKKDARMEDLAESERPEHAWSALADLRHPAAGKMGKTAHEKITALAKKEAAAQGHPADQHDAIAGDVANMQMGYPGMNTLDEQVRGTGSRFGRDRAAREAGEQIDKMNLTEGQRKEFRRQVDRQYDETDNRRVVEEARKAHQENEKKTGEHDDFLLSGITPEGVTAADLQTHIDGMWHPVKKKNVLPPDEMEARASLKRLRSSGQIRYEKGEDGVGRMYRVEEKPLEVIPSSVTKPYQEVKPLVPGTQKAIQSDIDDATERIAYLKKRISGGGTPGEADQWKQEVKKKERELAGHQKKLEALNKTTDGDDEATGMPVPAGGPKAGGGDGAANPDTDRVADMAAAHLGVDKAKLMKAAIALAEHDGVGEPTAAHVAEAAQHYQRMTRNGPEDEYTPGSPAVERGQIAAKHLMGDKPAGPWHGNREEVFEQMRKIEEEHERHRRNAQQFAPKHGQIGLGSQDFDHHLKAEVAMAFNRALRQGKNPQEATEYAKEEARATIKNWNTKGSKQRASISGNHEYQRDAGSGDTYAEDLGRRFRGIGDPAGGTTPTPTPDAGTPVPAENRATRAGTGEGQSDLSSLPAHVQAGLRDHPGHHVIDSDGQTHTVYSPTGEKVSEGPHADLGGTMGDLMGAGKKVAVLDRDGRGADEPAAPAKKGGKKKANADDAVPYSDPNPLPSSQGDFDPAAWDKREAKIADDVELSRIGGAMHLDEMPKYVETLQGKKVRSLRDGSTGVVRTVANTGEVVVNWSNEESAQRNLASKTTEPSGRGKKKEVWQSWLMPHDHHEFVVEGEKRPSTLRDERRMKTVKDRLKAGKSVPPEVLADYPGLAKQYGKDANVSSQEGPKADVATTPPSPAATTRQKDDQYPFIDGANHFDFDSKFDAPHKTTEGVLPGKVRLSISQVKEGPPGEGKDAGAIHRLTAVHSTRGFEREAVPLDGSGKKTVSADVGDGVYEVVGADRFDKKRKANFFVEVQNGKGRTVSEYMAKNALKNQPPPTDTPPAGTTGTPVPAGGPNGGTGGAGAGKSVTMMGSGGISPQEAPGQAEATARYGRMPFDEFSKTAKAEGDIPAFMQDDETMRWGHRNHVRRLRDDGEDVPDAVKAEYPDLFPARAGTDDTAQADAGRPAEAAGGATSQARHHPQVRGTEIREYQDGDSDLVHHLKDGRTAITENKDGTFFAQRETAGGTEDIGSYPSMQAAVDAAADPNAGVEFLDVPEPESSGITYRGDTADESTDDTPVETKTPRKKATAAEQPADPNAPYTLAEHDATTDRLHTGKITPDELRQAHARLQQHKDAVQGELKKRTVPELKKLVGHWRASDMTKPQLLKYLHERMGEELVPSTGESRLISIGRDYDPVKEQAKQLEKTTDDHIQKHAGRMAAAMEERKKRVEQLKESVANPKTLEDYQRLARTRGGLDKLTPDELAKHDDLHAEARRGRSMAERQEKAKIAGFSGGEEAAGGIDIVQGRHQKRGEDTHTVTVANRLGDEKFQEALSAAKRLGGSYVNAMIAKRYNATPGFQFFDRAKAEQFAAVLRGESVDRSGDVAGEMAARQQNRAGTVAEKAESLIGQGEESLGRERRSNTRRQAEMAASAEAQAREKIATGKTLQRIGDGQADGGLKHLNGIRSAEDLHTLDRALRFARYERMRQAKGPDGAELSYREREAMQHDPHGSEDFPHLEYPHPSAHQSELQDIGRMLADEPGLKRFAEKMKKEGDPTADVKFQGSVGGMKANGGVLRFAHHFKDHPEAKYIAHHMQGDGEGDKAVRVHYSNDWRLAQAAAKGDPTEKHFGGFYTADKGKSWAKSADDAVTGAIRRGNVLDHIDAPREKSVKFTDPDDVEALRKAARKLRNHPNDRLRRIGQSLKEKLEHHDRLKRADIHSLPELRAALREYLPLKTAADKEDPVKKAERDLKGKDIPGFFPTPRPAVEEMLDRADIQPGHMVLEPSAGKGDILDAIRERHPDAQTHALEYNSTLRDILQKKGHNVVGNDALDHVGQYDRIVMNPPFEQGADREHVRHQFDHHLAPGGRMVAIMSEGPFSRSQKADQEFREWLESVGGVHEPMPEGSFAGNDAFRKTGVRTRMVTIDKPG